MEELFVVFSSTTPPDQLKRKWLDVSSQDNNPVLVIGPHGCTNAAPPDPPASIPESHVVVLSDEKELWPFIVEWAAATKVLWIVAHTGGGAAQDESLGKLRIAFTGTALKETKEHHTRDGPAAGALGAYCGAIDATSDRDQLYDELCHKLRQGRYFDRRLEDLISVLREQATCLAHSVGVDDFLRSQTVTAHQDLLTAMEISGTDHDTFRAALIEKIKELS